MDGRIFELHRALERARARVAGCRRELDRFERQADPSDHRTEGLLRKLEGDVHKAEVDAGWAEVNLADATSPTEVPAAVPTQKEIRHG